MTLTLARYLSAVLLMGALATGRAAAQSDTLRADTVRTAPMVRADSVRRPTPAPAGGMMGMPAPPAEEQMSRSPLKATLYGIIPGGGQVYDGNYIRAVAFAGACGIFLGRAIYYHSLFLDKADEAAAVPAGDPRYTSLRFQRENYRDTRDLNFAIYLGVHILSLIDAYVGAYLYDFNVDDDISSSVILDPLGRQVTLSLRW